MGICGKPNKLKGIVLNDDLLLGVNEFIKINNPLNNIKKIRNIIKCCNIDNNSYRNNNIVIVSKYSCLFFYAKCWCDGDIYRAVNNYHYYYELNKKLNIVDLLDVTKLFTKNEILGKISNKKTILLKSKGKKYFFSENYLIVDDNIYLFKEKD
jgi:hypothetical protein